MKHRFGKIENGAMILNEYGQIAHDEWMQLIERFHNMDMDVFQIMPNHMHSIIELTVGSTLAVDRDNAGNDLQKEIEAGDLWAGELWAGASPARTDMEKKNESISDIVGAYKSLVSNGCLDLYKIKNQQMGKLWQRNYYEHIIRNEQSYQNISNYIINNPAKWNEDKFYKK
jgi:REP element-mobilizing transposase RayT